MSKIVDTGKKYSGAKKDRGLVYVSKEENQIKLPKKTDLWKEPDWINEALKNACHAYYFMVAYKHIPSTLGKEHLDLEEDYKEIIELLKSMFEAPTEHFLNGNLTQKNNLVLEGLKNKKGFKEVYEVLVFLRPLSNKQGKLKFLTEHSEKTLEKMKKMGFGKTNEIAIDNIHHVGGASFRGRKNSHFFTIFKNDKFVYNDKDKKELSYIFNTEEEANLEMEKIIKKEFWLKNALKNINKQIKRKSPLEGENRVGDLVKESDVSVEEFMSELLFKGIEFGNWVSQDERQQFLNCTYNAFYDLNKVLGFDMKAASLYNKLGIAFGSRGTSKASAHFEPDNNLIHITKTKAIGSLAHEYGHALDYYLTRKLNLKCWLSEVDESTPYYEPENYALIDAFIEWNTYLKTTQLFKNSQIIDKEKNKKYYSTDKELFARCFEQYVKLELTELKQNNNFLVYDVTPESENDLFIYAIGEEQKKLKELMNKILIEAKKNLNIK